MPIYHRVVDRTAHLPNTVLITGRTCGSESLVACDPYGIHLELRRHLWCPKPLTRPKPKTSIPVLWGSLPKPSDPSPRLKTTQRLNEWRENFRVQGLAIKRVWGRKGIESPQGQSLAGNSIIFCFNIETRSVFLTAKRTSKYEQLKDAWLRHCNIRTVCHQQLCTEVGVMAGPGCVYYGALNDSRRVSGMTWHDI